MATSLTYITATAPGVYTNEIDDTTSVPGGASSTGAIVGVFSWGPVNSPRLIASEDQLATTYGTPSDFNAETWFSAANFLAYGNALYVNRVADTTNSTYSAVANTAAVNSMAIHTIENQDDYDLNKGSFETAVNWIAKYPGTHGNGLKVSICASPAQWQSNVAFGNAFSIAVGSNTGSVTTANAATANTLAASLTVGDIVVAGNTSIGTQNLKITSISNPNTAQITLTFDQPLKLSTNVSSNTITRKWEFATVSGTAPSSNDSFHMVIVDTLGKFTAAGTVVETWSNLSRGVDSDYYYPTILNAGSKYVWSASPMAGLPVVNTAASATVAGGTVYTGLLGGGTDGSAENSVAISILAKGWDLFDHKSDWPFAAAIVGQTRGGVVGEQILNYVLDNVAMSRMDIVAYASPPRATVVNNQNVLNDLVTFRGNVRYTSYGFLDSGYKYMYDKYNNVYRYVPLCGDTAGISCRSDLTNNPWTSPAGLSRGQYKNIIKLSYNPNDADRTVLDANDINAVITKRGDGTYLFDDKTLLGQQSALNQLGTRKMFNVLKTNISKATEALLFEFNDEFTQNRFKSMTEPYLRQVQASRGLTQFQVICDDTNNTQAVVTANQFVGDIYLQPARSIRVAQLNFIATDNVASFVESA